MKNNKIIPVGDLQSGFFFEASSSDYVSEIAELGVNALDYNYYFNPFFDHRPFHMLYQGIPFIRHFSLDGFKLIFNQEWKIKKKIL